MGLEDYKVVLYRNHSDGWVAEIPAIAGCHALVPAPEQAFAKLAELFGIIEQEYREQGKQMPAGAVESVSAQRSRHRKGAPAFHS